MRGIDYPLYAVKLGRRQLAQSGTPCLSLLALQGYHSHVLAGAVLLKV